MKRGRLGLLLAGGVVAAAALLATSVPASLPGNGATDSIQFGWSRTSGSNDDVDQTWWAVRSPCSPETVGERLLCIPVGLMARGTATRFEAGLAETTSLPLPAGWTVATAKSSPLIDSVYAETPRDVAAVLADYRDAFHKRGWTETDDAIVAPDRAAVTFGTAAGRVLLRLSHQDDKTIAELSRRKLAFPADGLLSKPGQGRLMLGNKADEAALITVGEQTIRLAAHAGEKLANSRVAAAALPDDQRIDLAPGTYKVILQVGYGAAQTRAFEVAASETWGLLVGSQGILLPMRIY